MAQFFMSSSSSCRATSTDIPDPLSPLLPIIHGCTTGTLTKRLKKKLDGNYSRMLRAILNKSWRQHPTRHQLYGHLPPIMKTILYVGFEILQSLALHYISLIVHQLLFFYPCQGNKRYQMKGKVHSCYFLIFNLVTNFVVKTNVINLR